MGKKTGKELGRREVSRGEMDWQAAQNGGIGQVFAEL